MSSFNRGGGRGGVGGGGRRGYRSLAQGDGSHNYKFLGKRLWTGSVPSIFNFKHRYLFVFVVTPS